MLHNAVDQIRSLHTNENGTMAGQAPVAPQQAALVVTQEEAKLILDGLHILRNCRRYSFKEPHEDPRQLYGQLFDTIEHLERLVQEAFGK